MAQRLEMFVRLMNQVERDRNIECVIFDRCIHSDAVFLKNAFNSGLMTKEEYDSFMAVREIVQRDMPKPTLIIDLRVSPQECFRRVHHVRKESSESPMTLEYLEAIDLCYQEYYNLMRDAHGIEVFSISWENFGKSTPELNVSTEYTDMVDFTRMVDKIKEVIRAKQRED
jgi:thymidylate kinase